MTADRLLGSTLGRLSIKPPPVICAHALILFRLFCRLGHADMALQIIVWSITAEKPPS